MNEYNDDLMGHVEWAKNNSVLVFQREYGNQTFIRMRVFNQHKRKNVWYPSPRAFHVGQECAYELGQVISLAGQDRESGPPPEWWAEFETQYERKAH